MAKRKNNALRLSDVQKGWAAIAIAGIALMGYLFYNYTPAAADGMIVPPENGVSLNLSESFVERVLGKFLDLPEPTSPFDPSLGAVSGPDMPFRYIGVNGLQTYYTKKALGTATSTPCSIQAPAATSTLLRTALRIGVATSTGTVWDAAKSTTAFASTTPLTKNDTLITLASGIQGTMTVSASSTDINLDNEFVFAPNEWIVWKVGGTVIAGSTFLTGTCSAVFEVI